jgi:hypothetical protein
LVVCVNVKERGVVDKVRRQIDRAIRRCYDETGNVIAVETVMEQLRIRQGSYVKELEAAKLKYALEEAKRAADKAKKASKK